MPTYDEVNADDVQSSLARYAETHFFLLICRLFTQCSITTSGSSFGRAEAMNDYEQGRGVIERPPRMLPTRGSSSAGFDPLGTPRISDSDLTHNR